MTHLSQWYRSVIVWLVAGVLPVASCCLADDARDWDLQYVRALRAHRLVWVAERVARRRLQRASTAADAAPWALELVQLLASEAMESSGTDRSSQERAWEKVELIDREFRRRFPRSLWGFQVRLQVALARLARTRSLQLDALALNGKGSHRDEALRRIREERRALRALTETLDVAASRAGDRRKTMPPAVIQSLQNQAVLAEAKLLSWRGSLYAPQSNDRIAAFNAAVQRIEQVLAGTSAEDPLRVDALLLRAQALRQLGDLRGAAATLDVIARQKGLEPSLRLRIDAERLRLAQAQGKDPSAWPVQPSIGRTLAGKTDVEWDMTSLEALLQVASRDGGHDQATMQKIEQGVEAIARRYGPYWGRRAAQLLARHVARWGGGGSGTLLVKSAMERRREGNRKAAVELLDQAADAFRKAGDAAREFDSRYQAAAIMQESKAFAAAAERYRGLSLDLRTDPRAPAAHLLAIWNRRKAASASKDDDSTYFTWLDEQISIWPHAKATQRARWWMAQWLIAHNRLAEALSAFAGISPDSDLREAATQAAWQQWWTQIDRTDPQSVERNKILASAADDFRQVADRCAKAEAWPAACQALLREIAFKTIAAIEVPVDRMKTLDEWLEQHIARKMDVPCRVEAAWLKANLTPGESLPSVEPNKLDIQWYRWAVERWQLVHRSGKQGAVDPKRLADELQRVEGHLDANASYLRRSLRMSRAELLDAAGRSDQAKRLLEQLARDHPRDYRVQRAWAEWLLRSDRRDDWPKAEQAWRRLASSTRPGSDIWYDAKYGVARSLLKQGKPKPCLERIRYLLATRGPLPGPWDERFKALAEKCRAALP